ncbi:hypothetical protein PVAP13_9KG013141 [Panicum virgatum]|uniref:Uncharacterized protein n=1 Tax=Panicum virgatum TaxID=38727 RepID=A0A8T0NBA3_PANVG|nr:hypothetical protein PVAP13_9KG013141 [Panicum virgatum]
MRTSFWPALVTDLQDYWTPSKWLLCLGFVCTARENNKRNEKRSKLEAGSRWLEEHRHTILYE